MSSNIAELSLFDEPSKLSESNENIKNDWSEVFEQLESLIGYEAVLKIAEVFAGTTIYIPKNIITFKNYHEIRKEYKDGATYRGLSVKYGYTEMHIRNIIHKS